MVIHTHKGAMVASLTAEDAVDLFEARLVLRARRAQEGGRDGNAVRISSESRECLAEYEKAVKRWRRPGDY